MKQKYVIGLAIIIALSLVTQVPFGLMKQQEKPDPLTSILNMLSSIDGKLDTIIGLLRNEKPGSDPEILSVDVQGTQEVGGTVSLYIVVYDEDVGQALEISTKFIQLPPLSSASLVPSIGPTPAFVPDKPGDYGLRVTVTDDTGRSRYVDLTVTIPEPQPSTP
ncbi:MAG: hypothetical protein ABIJ47_16130 [Candidatus Bathyarchaeota archaeon]